MAYNAYAEMSTQRVYLSLGSNVGDRRAHLLSVTPKGRRVREAVRAGIRRREEELLARLSPGDRRAFLRALRTLSQP